MSHVGVVIGRFQVPSLHDGHVALLSAVEMRSKTLVVLVGVTSSQLNLHDPLPFICRAAAIQAVFPEALVMPIDDQESDAYWSERVDATLASLGGGGITIYGGRGNSLDHYQGRWPTETLDVGRIEVSGQANRDEEYIRRSDLFRAGMVYASKIRFPVAFQTVDIAVTQGDFVLLGQKRGEKQWRFPGGFVDPAFDRSLEDAAKREALEECGGIELEPMRYAGSTRIDDWRYRSSTDKITTAFFVTRCLWGSPKAGDDLLAVAWIHREALRREVHAIHQPLVHLFERFHDSPAPQPAPSHRLVQG